MTVKIGFYFDKASVDRVINGLVTLSEPLKPVFFSEEEQIKSENDRLSNHERFEKFRERNQAGFFLFSDDCSYNFFLYDKGYSVVYIYIDTQESGKLEEIFKSVSRAQPVFGHASHSDEYDHRNRYYITIGKNHIEDWIGRKLDKYISGVYWYTLLSNELLEKHQVDLTNLSSEAISIETLNNGSMHLLKFYEKPESWRENADRLDDLCEKVDGVFSRRSVELAVKGVTSYMEYDDIIAGWR